MPAFIRQLIFLCIASLGIVASPSTIALPADFSAAIDVEAEYVEYDRQSQTSIYRGNVRLSRGSILLTADEVTVTEVNDGNIRALATGNPATYQQVRLEGEEPLRASGKEIEYQSQSEVIELRTDATLTRGQDKLTSSIIRYNMSDDRIVAGQSNSSGVTDSGSEQPPERVRITIQPPNKDEAKDE